MTTSLSIHGKKSEVIAALKQALLDLDTDKDQVGRECVRLNLDSLGISFHVTMERDRPTSYSLTATEWDGFYKIETFAAKEGSYEAFTQLHMEAGNHDFRFISE